MSGWVTGSGDLRVEAACGPGDDGVTTVSVPASFNVTVEMAGQCDVDIAAWLEGTVNVSVAEGSISVNTVRGLRTKLSTGRGDVNVKHVEGNLDVSAGGDVELGKILGEAVNVEASGRVRCRAIYAKDLYVWAAGGVEASVLESELSGLLALGGATSSVGSSSALQVRYMHVVTNRRPSTEINLDRRASLVLPGQVNDPSLRALFTLRKCPSTFFASQRRQASLVAQLDAGGGVRC